ncbi:TPA: hypothetical protein KDY89_004399 [Vibrio parahaemolyticus]|uniref:hypothetical protein n=1 Tax=Vibrio campbellii TaxID=680 RepID=UPI001B813D28|nr:hypothetical protein [Vibrio campbellii]HBC3474267.1 hypothetical protein [Vibrio parahaemolyticus]
MIIIMSIVVVMALGVLLREFVTLPQDSTSLDVAYQQGFEAAMSLQSCFSNPYRGVVADVWADGFVAGKEASTQRLEAEAICK